MKTFKGLLLQAIAISSCFVVAPLLASSQTIDPSSNVIKGKEGESIAVGLNYSTDDLELSGLGVSLLFDSNKLAFEGFTSVVSQGLVASDLTANKTTIASAKNTASNQQVSIAWVSLEGNWPGKELTGPLAIANFKIITDSNTKSSILIEGDAAANSEFSSKLVTVNIENKIASGSETKKGGGLPWYGFLVFVFIVVLRKTVLLHRE